MIPAAHNNSFKQILPLKFSDATEQEKVAMHIKQ